MCSTILDEHHDIVSHHASRGGCLQEILREVVSQEMSEVGLGWVGLELQPKTLVCLEGCEF